MAETTTPKGKKNKALYIGLGVLALGGLIYFLMRKKGTTSTNVMINIANYSASDYEPLTDAQIKAKVDEVNGLINQLGVDETIKQLQSQIDSYMTDGSPESLAYASLLEDIIADLENQSRSTSSSVAPTDMMMGMGLPSSMTPTPSLSTSSIDTTKYPLIPTSQIESELANVNSLVASKGIAGAIADLNSRTGALLSSSNPIDQQLGLLLNEIIRLLGGTPLNSILPPISVISTAPSTTPSTNDLTAFVDPATKPLTTPTPTTTPTPSKPAIPQLDYSQFSNETYPLVPQTTLDTKVDEVNASVLANGLATTITNLLAQATTLDKSTLPAERELGKVYYDMAATLDILNNPANASKYTIKDANYWRNKMITYYGLTNTGGNITMFARQLYIYWAQGKIDFAEPIQSQYDALPNALTKNPYLINLINTNGAINVLNNVIWRLTPLGNLVAALSPIRQ